MSYQSVGGEGKDLVQDKAEPGSSLSSYLRRSNRKIQSLGFLSSLQHLTLGLCFLKDNYPPLQCHQGFLSIAFLGPYFLTY